MGGLKKGKGGGKTKGKAKEGRKEPKKVGQDDTQRDIMVPLQDRVAAVKPFWETLSQEERVKTLTVTIKELEQRAIDLAERQRKQAAAEEQMYPGETVSIDLEPSIEELLDTGINRLKEKPTWKLWQWLPDEKEFLDADAFRHYMESEHIEDSLRALLPKEEGKPVEKPSEAALRLRMSELLQRVHMHNRQMQEEPANGKRARAPRATPDQIGAAMRDTNIELINIMMEALEQEHEFLYHAVLFPITSCICEMLEENQRESNCLDLCYEDLEKLHPDEVARMCEWLTEKVDGFSSKTKPEAKDVEEEEEEEEGIGDVDLFALSEDHSELMVNSKWLQHLQERVLGDDGQPRKMKDGEDPFNMGLVLEWVYGTIVSTAEKARDGAKRTLGSRPPTATQAHDQLVQALREQQNWEKRAKDAKELLNRMLKSRKDAADLAQAYDTRRPAPIRADASASEPAELPDHVVVAMLQREVLLTEAKLHALDYELVTSDRKLRQLRSQLRQGEPEFERLKRELEEVKNQPRGLEGTFRSAAEMERHRAQMADAAIEEQLEVQTAFREHGARLQGIYDKRQRTEMEIARREQEIKQLKGWKQTVHSLIDRFEELMAAPVPPASANSVDTSKEENGLDEAAVSHHQALEAATRSITGQDMQLSKLRTHFHKDVRRQLYGDEDDRTFFDWIRQELRAVEKKLEEGRAVLHHLEVFLVNVACNDPGAAIGANLVLPLLQDRLDAKALEFAAQRAAAAEEAIMKMEEEKAERAKQEREKRQKIKQKAKDKVRTEKERLLAERDAKLEAERAVLEETKRAMLEKEELLRKQKLEEVEKRRQAEEEQMEARRQELLSQEDGYWRRRMAQEAQTQALQEESIVKAGPQADEGQAESTGSDHTTWKDDNDGFRDTAKGPRRFRNPKGPRKAEADGGEKPANGYARLNSRLDDTRTRSMREHDLPRENGFAHQQRRPGAQDGRTLPVRDLKGPRSSTSNLSERSRSGRTSPQLSESAKQRPEFSGPTTLPLRPRAEPLERPRSSLASAKPPAEAASKSAPAVPSAAQPSASAEALPAAANAQTELQHQPTSPEEDEAAAASPPLEASESGHDAEESKKEPPKPVATAPAEQEGPPPPSQEGQQETNSLPSSKSSSVAHELAPGTPAQQPPPVPLLVPTPNVAEGVPHQPGGGVIFMQNSQHQSRPQQLPRIVPPQGATAGAPPPPDAAYGRPHAIRREVANIAGPHSASLAQGMQNGPIPAQPRRPQIAPPRGSEPASIHPQPYQRGFPRAQQPPPPPSSAPGGQFPGQPMMPSGAAQPGVSHSSDSADVGSAPPMMVPGGPFMGSAGRSPQGGGPSLMYPGPQGQAGRPKMPGSQPMPQHVFVGNMVNPPYAMMPITQMMNGPPGPPNAPMQHPGGSPPHSGHMFPFAGGSPRSVPPQIRGGYRGPPPQHQVPLALQRQPGTTTLRASAPSFVPGGFRPSPSQQQQQAPRRPTSDHRRKPEDRGMYAGALPRPASTDALQNSASQSKRGPEGGVGPPAAPEVVPSMLHTTAVQLHSAAKAETPDLAAEEMAAEAEASTAPAGSQGAEASQPAVPRSASPGAPSAAPTSPPKEQSAGFGPPSSSHNQGGEDRERPAGGSSETSTSQPTRPAKEAAPSQLVASQTPAPQPPKWSSIAASMDRQSTNSHAGTSNGPLRKVDSADALRSAAPTSKSDAGKRSSPGGGNIRKSGSGSQLGTQKSSAPRTAGDKRKITRAGGVTWEGLQGDFHRLKLVRGLSNEAGRNNCFLNVIIQSLWHLRSFREALLKLQPQSLEARGSPPEDLRVLRALWNIFNSFNQPREELSDAADDTEKLSPSPNGVASAGEEADAKRAKREGQEDAAAAKVTKGWTVCPAELREALSSVSHAALRFDLTDMHDAAEVLDKIFSSLHRAEVGQLAEGEPDAALPQRVRIPVPGAPAGVHQNGGTAPKRGPSSLVESLFGLDVQVPSPPEDEEDTLTVKRSKGTGGAVVGRWQETAGRSGRNQGNSPKAVTTAAARKHKDAGVVEMMQFIKLYHLVPAQGLKVAYDHLIGSSFEEVLKEADVAEVLAQNANNSTQSMISRVAKTSDIVLLKRPKVFNLAIGWESAQAPADVINATIDALAPTVDPAGVFKSAPKGPLYHLRCVVCYFGHHYKAYALSEELNEWLLFDDCTISHIGTWKDVTASLRGSRLQPNLLFYEQGS